VRNRERFYDAFAHGEHRVLGVRLERFTLRHAFWLEVFESPLTLGGELSLVDLERAVSLCAMPVEGLDEGVVRLLRRGPSRWRKWGFALRAWRGNSAAEIRDFQEYLKDHGCPPAIHGDEAIEHGEKDGEEVDEDEFDRNPLPPLMSLISGVIRMTGWSLGKTWALTPGEAEWVLTGVGLHRGLEIKVKTPSDEAFEEELRKEKEEAVTSEDDSGEE
jgi:hypothetical protein